MQKLGEMVLKGVNCVHNDKIGQMVLNGVIWVHNTKIRLYGLDWVHNDKIRSNGPERSQLGTQFKKEVKWS